MTQEKVRCNDCINRRNLFGNPTNIFCKVSNKIEPLDEPLFCSDFEPINKRTEKK